MIFRLEPGSAVARNEVFLLQVILDIEFRKYKYTDHFAQPTSPSEIEKHKREIRMLKRQLEQAEARENKFDKNRLGPQIGTIEDYN